MPSCDLAERGNQALRQSRAIAQRVCARGIPVTPPARMNRLRRRVPEGAHCQPRRDRHPRRPHPEGDGDRLGRRLLGDRPRRAARARGRRGLPDRPRGPGRELPEHREDHRDRQGGRGGRRSIPATASSPRTPTSPGPAPRPASSSIGPPPEAIEAMGSKTRAREIMARGRGADRPRRDRGRQGRRRRPARRPRKPATRSPARRRAAAAARASASR